MDRSALIRALQGQGNVSYNPQPDAPQQAQSSVLQRAPSLVMGQPPPPPQQGLANIIADPMRKIPGVNPQLSGDQMQQQMARYMPRSNVAPGQGGTPNVQAQPGPGAGLAAGFDNPGGSPLQPTPSQAPVITPPPEQPPPTTAAPGGKPWASGFGGADMASFGGGVGGG